VSVEFTNRKTAASVATLSQLSDFRKESVRILYTPVRRTSSCLYRYPVSVKVSNAPIPTNRSRPHSSSKPNSIYEMTECNVHNCGFGGLEVACWPLVPKFAGSHPAKAVGFLGQNILSTPSFGEEVKPSVPCRSFTACKRSLNVTCKSEFRQNFRTFLAHSSTFRRWVLSCGDAWWRRLKRLIQIAQ